MFKTIDKFEIFFEWKNNKITTNYFTFKLTILRSIRVRTVFTGDYFRYTSQQEQHRLCIDYKQTHHETMSANGRGTMRPQSRSPPFLITGLVVALVILGANYWNMSSNNASLSAEVADLQDQIRILASKKNNYERKSDNAMLRIRDIEKNVNSKDKEVKSLKIELKELGSAKDACTNKLVSAAYMHPEMTYYSPIKET